MESCRFNLYSLNKLNDESLSRQDLLMDCEAGDFIYFDTRAMSEVYATTASGEDIGTLSAQSISQLMPFLEIGKSYKCFIDKISGDYGNLNCQVRCSFSNEENWQ